MATFMTTLLFWTASSAAEPPPTPEPKSPLGQTESSVSDQTRKDGNADAAAPSPPATPLEEARSEPVEKIRPVPANPVVYHTPVSVAEPHQALKLVAQIANAHLVRRAYVVYTVADDSKPLAVEFLRAPDGEYVAVVPAEHVASPGLRYTIELEQVDGTRQAVFASREDPQPVLVHETDLRERALLARLKGRRYQFSASADYVNFGSTEVETVDPTSGAVVGTRQVADRYYRIEGQYAFRPLKLVTEFGLRAGVVRGLAARPAAQVASGSAPLNQKRVGLNYAAPFVRMRIVDLVHADGEFVTSVTEDAFSVGLGGALVLGEPYGTNLVLGFETIQSFGTRFFNRMDIPAGDRVTVTPIIEVTDMPRARKFGVRLLAQIGVDVGAGFSVAVRGGYQARTFDQGGGSVGIDMGYAY
jgi:hypothetical protein